MVVRRSFAVMACLLSLSATVFAEDQAKSGFEVGASFTSDVDGPKAPSNPAAKLEAQPNASIGAPKASAESTKAAARPSGVPDRKPGTLRRDPKGKRGISAYWESIRHGDEAALARDFTKAEEAYRVAIGAEPNNPIGHFRKGQILLRAGKLDDAETAYQDALRLSDKDATARAAALFVLADIKERKGDRNAAILAWKAYSDHMKANPTAKGYPETATERVARLSKYEAIALESKGVRERIQLRIKEMEEANRRRAAKNPNEGR